MKLNRLQIALLLILFTALCSVSCSPRTNEDYQLDAQMSKTPESRAELLRKVQIFAASDDEEAAAAWQALQNQSRQKLLHELSGMAQTLSGDDKNRVFVAFTLCRLNYDYPANRAIVLSALSQNRLYKDLGGDWAADLVGRLMMQGDGELLSPLFSASSWSDGAMATNLISYYSRALAADPEHFLQLLASQPTAIRKDVMVLLEDHTLTAEERQKVDIHLSRLSRQSKLRETAIQIMNALAK